MSDQYCGQERRSPDQAWTALATQLADLHSDVGEIKTGMSDFRDGMRELATAITKLALVEERQSQASLAIERCFKLAERLEGKIESVSLRVTELEKAEPQQARTSEWVDRAVWAIVAASSVVTSLPVDILVRAKFAAF